MHSLNSHFLYFRLIDTYIGGKRDTVHRFPFNLMPVEKDRPDGIFTLKEKHGIGSSSSRSHPLAGFRR